MLMGEFTHTIDSKGRLIIPAKFREQLGAHFIVTRGLDGCLFGYPLNEWAILEQKLKALPLTKRDARAFVRFLRAHASLEKKCVIVGVSNRLEIWSAERWNEFTSETADNFDEIAEDLNIDF